MDHGSQFSDVAHYNSAKCDFYMPLIGGETPQSLVETKTDPEINRLLLNSNCRWYHSQEELRDNCCGLKAHRGKL